MGSYEYFKTTKLRGGKLGKIDALLNEKLKNVKWGEYKLGDLFEVRKGKRLPERVLVETKGNIALINQSTQNNMIARYSGLQESNEIYKRNAITFGVNTKGFGYQTNDFYTIADVLFLKSAFLNEKNATYFITTIKKQLPPDGWDKIFGLSQMKDLTIQLPLRNNKIDFEFIESFIAELEAQRIAELEAYLLATGLMDYTLTVEEQKALDDFEKGQIIFGEFTYQNMFNKIVQGRRLKKDDQKEGNIPFVMAGITNTGVVNYIANPVASFPKNSITVDIFGNTFYRSYNFGAGDDTGVYWNDEKQYSKELMLFFSTSMEKSMYGKFDFGNKLRSSQSLNFKMKLPLQNNQPSYQFMETFISAIQKLVIKEVVLYADRKIATTKTVVKKD